MNRSYKQRIYIFSIFLFLAIGAFFMVNVELPSWSYIPSAINIFIFAIPAFLGLKRWIGWKKAVLLFLILGIFALAIETNAILTGFPYGHFGYSDLLGYRLFGYTPWTVALAWTPLILSAYAVSYLLFSASISRIAFTASALVAFDLVIDPGAVLLGFWKYSAGGVYYGVPFINFVGWMFSGVLGAILIEFFMKYLKPEKPAPSELAGSSIFIIFFWTMISAFGELFWSAAIGILIVVGVSIFERRYKSETHVN